MKTNVIFLDRPRWRFTERSFVRGVVLGLLAAAFVYWTVLSLAVMAGGWE